MEKNHLMNGKLVYPNKLKISNSIKVAIIGSGNMANDYSKVVTSFGHEIKIFVSKSKSKNSIFLSKKYKSLLSNKISDVGKIEVDLIIICSRWSELYSDLLETIKLNKPTIVEKSVILNTSRYKKILKHQNKIFFAFNRNYYDFVNLLLSNLKKDKPHLIRLSVYDSYKNIIKNKGYGIKNYLPLYITSHWITFVYYLLKKLNFNLKFKKKFEIKDKFYSLKLFNINHKTNRLKKINLEILNHPNKFENHSLEFFGKNINYKLNSFEKLEVVNKLKKKKINSQFVYEKDYKTYNVDYKFKPGLKFMYYNFVNDYILRPKKNNHISLNDIKKIYNICNGLKLL